MFVSVFSMHEYQLKLSNIELFACTTKISSLTLNQHILARRSRFTRSVSTTVFCFIMQTYSAVNIRLSPHHVVLLVNHLGAAEDVEIFHNILLHISQGRDLREKPCENTTPGYKPERTDKGSFQEVWYGLCLSCFLLIYKEKIPKRNVPSEAVSNSNNWWKQMSVKPLGSPQGQCFQHCYEPLHCLY